MIALQDLAATWLRERGAELVGERRIANAHTKALAYIFRGSRPDGTAVRCLVTVIDGNFGEPVEVTNADRKRIGQLLRKRRA